MTKVTNAIGMVTLMVVISCAAPQEKSAEIKGEELVVEESPKQMLKQAYQLFKEGDDKYCLDAKKIADKI